MAGDMALLRDFVRAETTLHPLPWALSLAERQQAISHEGNLRRLHCLIKRIEAGESVKMIVLGGSDCEAGLLSVERMLRQVLDMKKHPAVVFVHVYPFWTMNGMPKGWRQRSTSKRLGRKAKRSGDGHAALEQADISFQFHQQWGHGTNEHMIDELAKYYSVPSISLRNVIWHQMKANQTFHGLSLPQLYYDRIHPSDFGHTIIAQGLIHLFKHARLIYHALRQSTVDDDVCAVPPPLSPPMQSKVTAQENKGLECYNPPMFDKLVEPSRCHGWQYVVERSASGVAKPGYIASTAGSSCLFAYHISNLSNVRRHSIGIGYLKSYTNMGRVAVECQYQCRCNTHVLEGHHEVRISPLDLIYIPAEIELNDAGVTEDPAHRPPRRCGFKLTVLNESSSGAHKFKLTGIFINRHGDSAYFGKWIMQKAIAGANNA
ncbi:hypothetical protein AB1Y20_019904 [Prymnesium parvum]|uniref:Uncharacterized protein n=1 Tax=Prymnesium parvum TaxID=97485 RepID=A0AB34JT58_PRYPA